jgi:hypothetical protein
MSMSLDDLFAPRAAAIPPEARRWETLAKGRQMVCEFLRRRDGLSWEPAQLQITFSGTDLPPEQTVLWDLELDTWLLERGVLAVNPKNEAERFGYRLDELFASVEERYGDGYFNSVLLTYLKESDLASRPNLREKLDAVHAYPPHHSRAAEDCLERITQVLADTAQTLARLYPDRAVAETILCDALAYYLDDRFNISTRAALGWD